MKLKKASLKSIICLMCLLALGTLLAACNKDDGPKPDYYVTFNYNVGDLISDEISDQYLGVMKGSLVSIRPGYDRKDYPEVYIDGYYVEGWYTAKTDEEGNPIKDDKNFVLLNEQPWDFETGRVYADMTLYAKLLPQTKIRFVDRTTGDYADNFIMGKPESEARTPSRDDIPRLSGYTFFGKYYVDREGTKEFSWPYKFGTEDIEVYVDFIEGEGWTFVYTAREFRSAINSGANIYLMNDVDFTDEKSFWAEGAPYNGVLNGRGNKVIGLKREMKATRRDYQNKGAIFGTIGAKAHIYDITFENCDVTYTVDSAPIGSSVGLFAWKADEGAKIENVTLTGKFDYQSNNGGVNGSVWIANDSTNAEDVSNINYSGVTVIKH